MNKLIVVLILTIATLSAFGQTTPGAHFKCTNLMAADIDQRAAGTDCAVITLQIETANATELRTWPGTDRNYSKAQAEWTAVDNLLREDIATRNMSAYRRHIGQLARRGPVTAPDAAYLVKLSYEVR
jgi:hypothetical protein